MEERGEVLDLAAAGAELELAAAVDLDPVRRAVVVEVEEPPHAPEARRLRVEAARRPLERLDVVDRVDREVPREPVAVRLERGTRLVVDARVLEPGLRERLGDAAVELRRRCRVDPVAVVQAFEVDDVDGARRGELRDDLVRPLVARVELETDPGVEREQLLHRALRDDERDGTRLPSDRSRERAARLAQRQVERRGLQAPDAVARLGRHELRERVDACARL